MNNIKNNFINIFFSKESRCKKKASQSERFCDIFNEFVGIVLKPIMIEINYCQPFPLTYCDFPLL